MINKLLKTFNMFRLWLSLRLSPELIEALEAADELEQFLTNDVGMDKPELTNLRWHLAKLNATLDPENN